MIEGMVIMMVVGTVCGLILSVASRVFHVKMDPRIELVESCFAGANCGGCGYAGCSAAAVAVVHGPAPVGVCVVGGAEAAQGVSQIMGTEAGVAEPATAANPCTGGLRAPAKYLYMGAGSCRAEAMLYGGKPTCEIGCLGHGDCVRACRFNALRMGPDGYPQVDARRNASGAAPANAPAPRMSFRSRLHPSGFFISISLANVWRLADRPVLRRSISPSTLHRSARGITKGPSTRFGSETPCCSVADGCVLIRVRPTAAGALKTSLFPSTN